MPQESYDEPEYVQSGQDNIMVNMMAADSAGLDRISGTQHDDGN
jgi:hypothetical protein